MKKIKFVQLFCNIKKRKSTKLKVKTYKKLHNFTSVFIVIKISLFFCFFIAEVKFIDLNMGEHDPVHP